VNGSALVDTGATTVVEVVGSGVPRSPIGAEVVEVTPRPPTVVGVDVLDELDELLELEVDELEDDSPSTVVLVVEVEEGSVLDVDELEDDVSSTVVLVVEVDDEELDDEDELDEDELDEDELVVEVGWLSPTQNRTWLMVGGWLPPFSGGCTGPPLVTAGS